MPPTGSVGARTSPEAQSVAPGAGCGAVSITHHVPDCTGRWGAELHAHQMFWICSQCGAVGPDTDENHDAVVRENTMGLWLQQLGEDGRRLLERERSG